MVGCISPPKDPNAHRVQPALNVYSDIVQCAEFCKNPDPTETDFVFMVSEDKEFCVCKDERVIAKQKIFDKTPLK